MGLWTQFTLLLWKNFSLRKRQKVRLVVEVIWPLVLFFILMAVRSTIQPIHKGQCHYPNKAMPSAGVLPWIQGMMCNIQNPCWNYSTPGETPGQVNNFNNSIISRVLLELQALLQNRSVVSKAQTLADAVEGWNSMLLQFNSINVQPVTLRSILRQDETFSTYLKEDLSVPETVVDSLMNATVNITQVRGVQRPGGLRTVLCEGTNLDEYVQFSSPAERETFQNISCSLTEQQLIYTQQMLLQNLDVRKVLSGVTGQNNADTMIQFNDVAQSAFPLMQELVRLQASAVFQEARELNFQQDMIGSFNMLLCGEQPDFSSNVMTLISRSSTQMSGFQSIFITGNTSDDFCQNFIDTLENTPGLRNIWATFKPLVLGKILYTPDTPVSRLIVSKANSTLDALAKLKELADMWVELGPRVYDFFQNGTQVNTIRALLANPVFATVLDQRLEGTGWTAELIANFLYNGPPEDRPPGMPTYDWRDVYQATDRILTFLSKFLSCLDLNKFQAVSTEHLLVIKALDLVNNDSHWASVVFENLQPNSSVPPVHIKYKIRMDTNDVEHSDDIEHRSWSPGARDNAYSDLKYVMGGFVYLQDMMDHGIIQVQTSKTQPLGVFAQQMPYPCYVNDSFTEQIATMISLIVVLAFIYTVSMTIKDLVLEKELRLKDVLRAVGVHNSSLWLARLTENIVLLTVPCLLISVLLKYGKLLRYSDPSLVFVFLLVYCVVTISQCFLISVFFSKANLAAACGGLIYFVLYLPHVFFNAWRDVLGFPVKVAVSVLSCVSFGFGCESFTKYEEQGIGIQWHNMHKSPEDGERFTFLLSIIMMLFDAVLYWTLTWYIENVFPGEYGIPKPWYFPFTSLYWCGPTKKTSDDPDLLKDTGGQGYLEKPPPNMRAGVSVRNLVKIYKTGNKLAVDGLTVDFYENQITSFLGHNGAGKTTTMSILTGLFTPTSGTALINGYDIHTDMDSIRKYLGMCPQHNVLFNELTVEEHIYFYARLKGLSRKEVEMEMEQMIIDVGLPHKRKDLAKNLSGGMQRKLSVAIAFVGGSKIVILDEPTAGVDPYARRGIWELLLKYKQGRTIILSTHHMDEADILGDRIAIISHGRMRCCGSSLFLKKCFGSGYYLTLVRDGTEKMAAQRHGMIQSQAAEEKDLSGKNSPDDGIGSQTLNFMDPSALGQLVRRHVPAAVFLESIGQEITYVLPYSAARDGTFALLFQELDESIADLGLTSYGISDTSLEEIFLKVAEETGVDVEIQTTEKRALRDHKRNSQKAKRNSISSVCASRAVSESHEKLTNKVQDVVRNTSVGGRGSTVITGKELIRRQFLALFIKRFHHARRSRKGIIGQMILPPVFVCLSLIFTLIIPSVSDYPSLELQPWMYGLPQNTFFSNDMPNDTEVSQVVESLVNSPGFGTRCMEGDPILNLPCSSRGTDWFTPPVDQTVMDIFLNGNWTMANPSPSCQCSTPQLVTMLPRCPPGAGGLPPPQRIQNTTDTLQDLSGRNMTDFLIKTFEKSGKFRYGGLSVGEVNSQVRMTEEDIEAAFVDLKELLGSSENNVTDRLLQTSEELLKKLGTKNNVKVWFYNQAYHSLVSFLGVANNAILRGNLPAGENPRQFGISVSNHPLNLTKEQLALAVTVRSSTDVVVSICIIFAMSFIPASFVLFLIQERVSKAKHLQFVSGVNPTVYWLANFAWDMCNYILASLIVVLIFIAFQKKAYVSAANLPALILLLLLYGWSITPMMYPASFVFSVPSTAYVVLTCINLFIGINGSMATFFMELLDDEEVTHVNDIMKQVLLIFPHFCLGRGLIDMATNQVTADLFSNFGEDRFKDPLSWNMVGRNLCSMSILGAVMFAVTILIQYKFFCKPRLISGKSLSAEEEDIDVARERDRVYSGKAQSDLLRIYDLTKVYPRKKTPAVDRICVGVPAAECFGLLGINGAGKTTTFKMLTGDIPVSGGEAFLNGYSIRTEMRDVHQSLGYCPQFDAIDNLLTGREHLQFYARLRGVPEHEVAMVAEWGIQKLGLIKYSNKCAGTYSGGNKRKLSTAIALMGCPPVIFLDEPTTGMDPKARRFLWDCILSIIKEGRSVILTSHSMEECEALCTRMAIMVNGAFKCLGSIQHLKNRFGDGYTVTVRVGGSPPALKPVEDFVEQTFAGSVLKEKHHNTLQYQLPYTPGALANIFSQFISHQQTLGVEDYSVSQTTLDQVFVNFARHQQGEEESQSYENPVDTSDEEPKTINTVF
ncbi:ATP-binding cassette sub-family A member 1 isoform X1 [Cynoglossus semilaevis]|uniref:ATP-binding cassette sub-family A member 1 isoform X1 n=1 Tax=Cynoglossus semilaevis TaxID=244447 RepID=UPI0004972ECA|nr:ATP-binding cassette sub-family A member 1-like isoform X1 [Cynoglossus semilaevis]XP_024910519.1 ATP-binding cassette sub-family A member 1-like isoform X1 [Cynoglossus semilaevis]XP_024910558.1 ATP-binding cassette sub-family A member 1-like isoform X1 [Cynoglossus semilaevis]XP_024910587.1 ATP-binding cassette sub-family A member 1-like isoform X1 [Cynoglossus semilaevis]XP_024910634.1 ATP-binding cassette sub-family A member 1-like isoform X1 [Cynoglossus semilaevis]XP_024910667.1 ATP-b